MAPAEGFVVSSLRSEHSGSRFDRLTAPRKIEGRTAEEASRSVSSPPTLLAIETGRLANSTGMLHI